MDPDVEKYYTLKKGEVGAASGQQRRPDNDGDDHFSDRAGKAGHRTPESPREEKDVPPTMDFTDHDPESALEDHGDGEVKLGLPRWQKITLVIGFSLTAYTNGVENFVMHTFTNTAAAIFGSAVQYSTLSVIQAMIVSTAKPPFAKLADVYGRSSVYILSVVTYVLGNIITAVAQNINHLAAGVVLSSIGNAGIALGQQLLVADLIPPRYRGMAYYLIDIPFFINYGVSPKISGALIPERWRWGPGMCGIILPVVTVPIITILILQERQASRAGILRRNPYQGMGVIQTMKNVAIDFDLLGMLCFAGGFLLILIPLTIADRAPKGYASSYIIGMLVAGGVLLISWPIVERYVPRPLIRFERLVKNRDILVPACVWCVDQISNNMVANPLFQWIQVVFGWSVTDATYFNGARTLMLVAFGIIGGAFTSYTKRYKWLTIVGGGIRLLGIGLMYKYRQASSSTVQVVMPQLIQGLGDGFMTVNLLAIAQSSVDHGQVASVTGFMLLIFQVGVAVGSAISGSVQKGLRAELHKNLDQVTNGNSTLIDQLYGGGSVAAKPYPIGTPIRDGIIVGWTVMMRRMITGSIVVGGITWIMTWFLTNKELSATSQNNVAQEDLSVVVSDKQKASTAAR